MTVEFALTLLGYVFLSGCIGAAIGWAIGEVLWRIFH